MRGLSLSQEQVDVCHNMFLLWDRFYDARVILKNLFRTLPMEMAAYMHWLCLRWVDIRPRHDALPTPFIYNVEQRALYAI